MRDDDGCPCGSTRAYGGCCGPLHRSERHAETAEELMRSRYAAYAVGDTGYLWRTWHPRTRPDEASLRSVTRWVGLEVVDTVDGEPWAASGVVEFVASYADGRRTAQLRERSRFERRGGRWLYVGPV